MVFSAIWDCSAKCSLLSYLPLIPVRQINSPYIVHTDANKFLTIVFLLQYADNVVVLEGGCIVETGSLDSLKTPNSYIQELKAASATNAVTDSGSSSDVIVEAPLHPDKNDEALAEEELHGEDSYDGLNRQEGDFSIYSYYASASGRVTCLSCVIVALLWAFCREFTSTSFSLEKKLNPY